MPQSCVRLPISPLFRRSQYWLILRNSFDVDPTLSLPRQGSPRPIPSSGKRLPSITRKSRSLVSLAMGPSAQGIFFEREVFSRVPWRVCGGGCSTSDGSMPRGGRLKAQMPKPSCNSEAQYCVQLRESRTRSFFLRNQEAGATRLSVRSAHCSESEIVPKKRIRQVRLV